MRLVGKTWKSKTSSYWLGEIPLLDITTQARTKKAIAGMIKDAIESLINDTTFVSSISLHDNVICLEVPNTNKLIGLILKRQRQKQHLTIEDVAKQLGAKSINEYAQYEQGKHQPSFEKFERLLKAIDPALSPTISCI